MLQEFVSAMLPWMVIVHVVSIGILVGILLIFLRVQGRRKQLIESLAVTTDDDDETMHQWFMTARRQRRLLICYVLSTLTIAIVSTLLFYFLPTWL